MRGKQSNRYLDDRLLLGRAEWCGLPELHIPFIKAKIDTGAKTSSLHAMNIFEKETANGLLVCFDIAPLQGSEDPLIHCQAAIIDRRHIMSSNGHKEKRYIITTSLALGDRVWPIELSLSNRDPLRYRMLLGRESLNHKALIDPGISLNQGKVSKKRLQQQYKTS